MDLIKELTDTINNRLPVYTNRRQLLEGYTARLEQNHDDVAQSISDRADLIHQLVDVQKVGASFTALTRLIACGFGDVLSSYICTYIYMQCSLLISGFLNLDFMLNLH